jgi:hypothetical protein
LKSFHSTAVSRVCICHHAEGLNDKQHTEHPESAADKYHPVLPQELLADHKHLSCQELTRHTGTKAPKESRTDFIYDFKESIHSHKTYRIIENTHSDHGKFGLPVVPGTCRNETITAA